MRLSNKNCAGLASKFPRLLKVLAVLLLLAAWAQPYRVVYAQTWPTLTGNNVVADNTGRLDAGQVSDGAQGLRSLGVKPLAVLSQGNLGFANSEALARAAAAHYGLGSNGGATLDPNLFLVAVVLDTRQSTILYGDRLESAME